MEENENNESLESDFHEVGPGMYGRRLILSGVSITAFDYPDCFERGYIPSSSECLLCEFYSQLDCPFRDDPSILYDVSTIFGQNQERWQLAIERRESRLDAIYSELRVHGRPLHYEILTRILRDRYPQLHFSPKMVVLLLARNHDLFEWVGPGVFRSR